MTEAEMLARIEELENLVEMQNVILASSQEEPEVVTATDIPEEDQEVITGYLCGITWQHELGQTDIKIYPTVDSIKNQHGCSEHSCGIVEVEVKCKRWIVDQDLRAI